METGVSRRDFLRSSAVATLGPSAMALAQDSPIITKPIGAPVVISSANGLSATARAMQMIKQGADTLDAVIAGVNLVEEDPTDHSVGYGGLPNEDGVVQLDSSVMHGPTHRAGAVAALQGIKTPSRVAQLVMDRTDHVLLVGKGALEFAKAHGFKEEELLTEEARKIWLLWKENLSGEDDWIPNEVLDNHKRQSGLWRKIPFTYGTINCNALDANGHLSGVTTTSGLSFKMPGRVGDSPLIGCGLYVDDEVGAAGSTGRGEAVILDNGAYSVVEQMRQGKSPEEACLAVLKRIIAHNTPSRLKREDGRPKFDVKFYAINKRGEYGAAAIWSDAQFAVNSAKGNRLEKCAYLFKRPFPPEQPSL